MNEVPAGMDWPGTAGARPHRGGAHDHPPPPRRRDRGLRRPVLPGAAVTCAPRAGPPVHPFAFHEGAAELAGPLADGLRRPATRAGPRVIAAYRRGAGEAGREPGEIVLQTLASFAGSDDRALGISREWKGTLVQEAHTGDLRDPADQRRRRRRVRPDVRAMAVASADPGHHARKLEPLRETGATAVVVMDIAGEGPLGLVRTYGETVLPGLRG